eukprot:scaffold47193_cov58-Attheya_sp.AAC.4
MTEAVNPAQARMRRREIIQSLKASGDKGGMIPDTIPPSEDVLPPKKRKISVSTEEVQSQQQSQAYNMVSPISPPSAPKVTSTRKVSSDDSKEEDESRNAKKAQIKYEPSIAMPKEQLAAWRREARRVRNRESAAASRQRIRDRIDELELEVTEWKSKYSEAMNHIRELQQKSA